MGVSLPANYLSQTAPAELETLCTKYYLLLRFIGRLEGVIAMSLGTVRTCSMRSLTVLMFWK